jgi:hypothetical protein
MACCKPEALLSTYSRRITIEFTCKYNETVQAQTVVVYSWNENSENGAPLIPTLGNGTFFDDTLFKILPLNIINKITFRQKVDRL